MLEHHQVAAMRRGPGGGLFVVAPDPGAVTDIVALYLARQGNDVLGLGDLRMRLEVVLVEMAMAQLDEEGVIDLREALEREQHVPEEAFASTSHDLHAVVARLAGNRALELVALVLIRLTRLHQIANLSATARSKIGKEVRRTHADIVEAVIGGDTDLARHRMRKHLRELTAFYA
jgi:DNA-binding FadR family transcriptional regulator